MVLDNSEAILDVLRYSLLHKHQTDPVKQPRIRVAQIILQNPLDLIQPFHQAAPVDEQCFGGFGDAHFIAQIGVQCFDVLRSSVPVVILQHQDASGNQGMGTHFRCAGMEQIIQHLIFEIKQRFHPWVM